jgi:hypothetical protein
VPGEISGLQKNWKERVQNIQPQRSSITPSHQDSGDEFDDPNDQVASKVQAIQKKQQTTAKVNTPGQKNHQDGTKTVPFIY